MLGAFGAHGLTGSGNGPGYLERKYWEMEPKTVAGFTVLASYHYLKVYEKGVEYHMTHTLAMAITGLLMLRRPSKLLSIAAWCFLAGILFFSGSLYVLVIGGPRWLGIPWGMIAPLGGTLLLVGWLSLAAGAWNAASCRPNEP